MISVPESTEKRRRWVNALIVGVASVIILAMIVGCYFLLTDPNNASEITMPEYTAPVREDPIPEAIHQDAFAAVTADNVRDVLATIHRVEGYYCALTTELFWSEGSVRKTISVWSRSGETRLQMTNQNNAEVKQILLTETQSWLWYDGETPVTIPQNCSIDDLIGIPTYESVLDNGRVLDAAFTKLAGEQSLDCIYLRWQSPDGSIQSFWIAVETGLLVRATIEVNGVMTYQMQQTAFTRLLPGDEDYDTPFQLPGSED